MIKAELLFPFDDLVGMDFELTSNFRDSQFFLDHFQMSRGV